MKGCLKKSSSGVPKSNSRTESATKSNKVLTFSNSEHEFPHRNSSDFPIGFIKKGESGKQVTIKHLKPVNRNNRCFGISNDNLTIEKPVRLSASSDGNYTVDKQHQKNKVEIQVDQISKKFLSNQSNVAVARKKYAHLSQCSSRQNLTIKKLSILNNQNDSNGFPKQLINTNQQFVNIPTRIPKLDQIPKIINNTERLSNLKFTKNVIYEIKELKQKNYTRPANAIQICKRNSVDSLLTTTLGKTFDETNITDLYRGLNPQELYKLQVPNPTTSIQLLCTKCMFLSFNKPRKNMPLLILDLDETLCNFVYGGGVNIHAKRPHLDTFMKRVYKYFDIAIWSATRMETLLKKLNYLQMINNPLIKYKILFCLDLSSTMIATVPGFGRSITKPLQVIWELFKQYDPTNTLIVDDKPSNFHFNPRQGVRIDEYKQSNFSNDNELLFLSQYLCKIAYLNYNFLKMNHDIWKKTL